MTAPSPSTSSDRSMLALIAAAVVVIAAVVLVLVFGIARPPALSTLADEPDPAPTAEVAWTTFERDGTCLHVAHPDGTTRSLRCDLDGGEVLAWDDDGIVLQTFGPRDRVEVIDPRSGEVAATRPLDDGPIGPLWDVTITSRHRDGVLTVTRNDTGAAVWEVEAPEGYRVNDGSLSPDGRWIAMVDTAKRLLIVAADGSGPPRLWVEDATAWGVPVWEGTPLEGDDADGDA